MPLTLWGHPILDLVTVPLSDAEFGAELVDLTERMLRVMYAAHGAGLAAPQVGIAKRLFVFDCEGQRGVVANPVIIERSVSLSEDHEGCLSVPGFYWPTPRASSVVVQGRDAYGESVTVRSTGYLARCLQHETDHLDGQLYLSRLRGRLGKIARSSARQAGWYGRPHQFIAID